MARGDNDLLWSAIILGLLVLLALIITPIILIGIPAYIIFRLWRENPKRLERLACEETMLLYDHARAGSANLSDSEVETALAAHWPHDTPRPLYFQLQELGKALFEAEGLSPKIPPPPALCNTIEGARYRDMLARVGQARNDRVMVLSALETISESLATIANVAPPIDGDVLVEITQFAHPLNQAVHNIIAPFFQDNDYNHFKNLKAHLDANLTKTHRANPVFPRDYKGDDVVDMYLSGTILKELFILKTAFTIPEDRRFEHMHMVAGSGHGKTQTMQYFIAKDLEDVARGDKSVVVIDSQGDLINNILKAKHLPPEKIVLIDPEDIEPPPLYRRLQSKQRWSLWKKVTEQTDIRLKCALARFG